MQLCILLTKSSHFLIHPVRMHGSLKFEFWPSFLALIAESVNPRKHSQQTLLGHCTALRSIMPVSWFIWDGERPWLYVLRQIIFSQLLLRQVNPVGQPRTIPWTWSAALIASLHTPSSSELNYDSTLHILRENALGLSTIDRREFESPLSTAKVILKRSDGRKFRVTARSPLSLYLVLLRGELNVKISLSGSLRSCESGWDDILNKNLARYGSNSNQSSW